MKLRLVSIIATAMLLVGCCGAPESGDTSEKPESTTTATTTAATTTTATTSATEPTVTEQSSGGLALDGVVLTEEQKELRKLVSGAKDYCDFEELGVKLTENSGFADKMRQMCGAAPDSKCSPIGCDEEFFYFEVSFLTGDPVYDDFYNEYDRYYFELNCDSGDIAQIYHCSGEDGELRAIAISKDAILLVPIEYYYYEYGGDYYEQHDGECRLIHRNSGNEKRLKYVTGSVLIGDTLYYERYTPSDIENGIEESYDLFTMQITEKNAIENKIEWYDLTTDYPHSIERGVYNIVFRTYDGGSVYRAVTDGDYITHDAKGRVQDFVFDTYYHCSAVMESNLLGWRSRLSIFDRNGNEALLTIAQTGEHPDIRLHATEDGIIFLELAGEQIVLVGEKNCFNDLKAAFLPNDVFSEHYTVYYDNNRLYFYTDGDDKELLVTLSR